MNLTNITYRNELIEDRGTFDLLPSELKEFYLQCNGLVALNGGIQFRGCVFEPKWISLIEIWKGNSKLDIVYDVITKDDIPIAQDGFGDQYIYRDGQIYRLCCESGELENLNCSFTQFLKEIEKDPRDYLALQQIEELRSIGIKLKNGEMMNVFPALIVNTNSKRSYRPIPTNEQIEYLKDLYLQTKDLEDGEEIEVKIRE